jgi:hypothetical protein
MVTLKKIRELNLTAPSRPGRPSHMSAASALVVVKSFQYVVADDELHLGVFPAQGTAPGQLFRMFEGNLPRDKSDRKKVKPDLEALVLLPSFSDLAHGALLAVGSGSRGNRMQGVLLALDRQGALRGEPRLIDLSPLFGAIEKHVDDLNIEGAVVVGDRFVLLQRGNKGGGLNALVTMSLNDVLGALGAGDSIVPVPFDVRTYELGAIDGVPLCFTDGAALPDGRIVFSAVAEDTDNSYSDGPCAGAAVGVLGSDGHLQNLERLVPGAKAEGIAAHVDGSRIQLQLVTDADDYKVPASLYAAQM